MQKQTKYVFAIKKNCSGALENKEEAQNIVVHWME